MKDKEEAKKYAIDLYYYYKAKGICPSCGKQEAEPNKVFCFECATKRSRKARNDYKKNKEYRDKQLSKTKENAKKRREYRKEQGLCVICGKRKSNPQTICPECRIKIKRRKEKKELNQGKIPRSERYYYNMCFNCSKVGLYKETRYCEECYKKMSETRKKWHEKNKKKEKEGVIEGKIVDKTKKKEYISWNHIDKDVYALYYPERYQLVIQRNNNGHIYKVLIDVDVDTFKEYNIGDFYKKQ